MFFSYVMKVRRAPYLHTFFSTSSWMSSMASCISACSSGKYRERMLWGCNCLIHFAKFAFFLNRLDFFVTTRLGILWFFVLVARREGVDATTLSNPTSVTVLPFQWIRGHGHGHARGHATWLPKCVQTPFIMVLACCYFGRNLKPFLFMMKWVQDDVGTPGYAMSCTWQVTYVPCCPMMLWIDSAGFFICMYYPWEHSQTMIV